MLIESRMFVLPLILLVFSGCKQQDRQRSDVETAVETDVETAVETDVLSELEIASIRHDIQQCGGLLRLDQEGQPVSVDLAVERGSADQSGLQAALRCARLKSLRIRAAGLSEGDLAGVASLVSLEELFLQDVPIQDDLLATLSKQLTSLRRLTLRNVSSVTSTDSVGSFPELTHLALIDMPIGADALVPLTETKNLGSLDLRMCSRLGSEQLTTLADIPGLKELKLGGYAIDNASMVTVASITTLQSLTIEDASIDAMGLAELTVVGSRLRSLSLVRCSGLGDDELKALEAFDSLRALVLRDMPVTGEFLQHLGSPELLDTLSLNQTFLIEESMDAIVRCRNLKRLELSQNILTAHAVEKLSTLVGLEYLNLTECGLDAVSLQPLQKLAHLKTLLVDGISDADEQTAQEILSVSGEL